MKNFKFIFIWAAILLAAFIGFVSGSFAAFMALMVATALINASFTHNRRNAQIIRLTLSVPELSQLVIEAFKVQTPELFGPGGFALDVSSDTAVLNDRITSHIGAVPTPADYDPTPGKGFTNGVQDATDLLTDVPVTLSYFKHVPIRIKWLSQLSSKINLSVALMEQGYALRKLLVDTALGVVLPSNFTYQKAIDPANVNLDEIEVIRGKLNTQKAAATGRFGIVNTAFAGMLQSDYRVGSNLFYGQLNGEKPYRRYKNMAGFSNIFEYPDFPSSANLQGYFGDRRGIIVAVRPINIAKVTPEELGIPRIMSETRMVDQETKLPFIAVGWQDPGTGDLYISIGILFGVTGGNQGGGQDSVTDRAGVRIVTVGADI